jgi:hypothetical protein
MDATHYTRTDAGRLNDEGRAQRGGILPERAFLSPAAMSSSALTKGILREGLMVDHDMSTFPDTGSAPAVHNAFGVLNR